MFARLNAGRFAVHVLVLLGLFVIPWPGVARTYGAAFRMLSNTLLGSFGSQGIVRFEKPDVESAEWDGVMRFQPRDGGRSWHVKYHSRRWGYLPTVTLIALILATPVSWSRRVRAFGFGLALIHLFIALRVEVSLLESYLRLTSKSGPGAFRTIAEAVRIALSQVLTTNFVVPCIIWVAVLFRKEDWVYDDTAPEPVA